MTNVVAVSYKFDQEYHRFADYMGIDVHKRNDFEIAKKLSLLFDWAKSQTDSEKFSNIVGVVDKTRKNSGVSFTGETLVNFLHQRVRVEMDNKRSPKEVEPSKRERYKEALGSDEKIKASEEGMEKTKHEDTLAKRRNVDYIKRQREANPKPKLEKIPVIDAEGSLP